jgi:hypothetical protein
MRVSLYPNIESTSPEPRSKTVNSNEHYEPLYHFYIPFSTSSTDCYLNFFLYEYASRVEITILHGLGVLMQVLQIWDVIFLWIIS